MRGERSHLLTPDVDLDTHIKDMTALFHYEDIHDALLVGHSYGGMVVAGVASSLVARLALGHNPVLVKRAPVAWARSIALATLDCSARSPEDLPESIAATNDRLARLEPEAKTLATLNHPHTQGSAVTGTCHPASEVVRSKFDSKITVCWKSLKTQGKISSLRVRDRMPN